jgi:hypothetical protein
MVFAHDPQHSMLMIMNNRAIPYTSGWYMMKLLRCKKRECASLPHFLNYKTAISFGHD